MPKGNYGQCITYDYMGSRSDGGFAQHIKVKPKNLIHLPDNVSFIEGAMIEPAAVTLHGIRKIPIKAGDTTAVLGCGTLGLLAIQFIKILGATKVIAADIDKDKLKLAKELGADTIIDASKVDSAEEIMRITGGKGVEAVVETAGLSLTQEQCIRAAAKQGRILYLGSSHKDVVIPPKTFELIIRNELKIAGSWNSYSAPFPGVDWLATLGYVKDGRLKLEPLMSHQCSLKQLPEMIKKMYERKINFNKILVIMSK